MAFGRAAGSGRHTPDLIIAEIANVAWKKAVRKEVTEDQARFICGSARHCIAALHPGEALVERAVFIALELRHPVYDCLYLACADLLGSRLITADRRLLAAIGGTDFAPLAVHVDTF